MFLSNGDRTIHSASRLKIDEGNAELCLLRRASDREWRPISDMYLDVLLKISSAVIKRCPDITLSAKQVGIRMASCRAWCGEELGISGKQEIETYGVAEFVEKCKSSVFRI